MRNRRAAHSALLFLTLAVVNCGKAPTAPNDIPDIPEPTVVGYSVVYGALGEATYFVFGFDEAQGAKPILRELLASGIAIRRAWLPHGPSPCLMMLLSQMIVELEAPDARILDHGFTADPYGLVPGACIPTWLQYSFEAQPTPARRGLLSRR